MFSLFIIFSIFMLVATSHTAEEWEEIKNKVKE